MLLWAAFVGVVWSEFTFVVVATGFDVVVVSAINCIILLLYKLEPLSNCTSQRIVSIYVENIYLSGTS